MMYIYIVLVILFQCINSLYLKSNCNFISKSIWHFILLGFAVSIFMIFINKLTNIENEKWTIFWLISYNELIILQVIVIVIREFIYTNNLIISTLININYILLALLVLIVIFKCKFKLKDLINSRDKG